jgi:hypothetical protein
MAKPVTAARGLHSYLVTLTSADTNYNLNELIVAVEAAAPTITKELVIQAASTNGSSVLIGDLNLSGTNYGYELEAKDSRTYVNRDLGKGVDVRDFYLRSSGAGQKVSVELVD